MQYLLMGIIAGSLTPFQTAVNSKLRQYVISPFLSSLISFLIGTIFLTIVILASGGQLLLTSHQVATIPWWAYLGGVLGMIGLTTNILLFPILGSVQTVIMPIMGQILMSMVIDNFGLFGADHHALSAMRLVGVVLLIIGVLVVVVLPGYLSRDKMEDNEHAPVKLRWLWQLTGVIVGAMLAVQAAINGRFGGMLASPLHAAWVSFVIGSILLFIVSLSQRSLPNVANLARNKTPWWIWLGGFLGAIYIFSNAFLVPKIGTGTVVVLALLGQVIGSLSIDQFGLLGAFKNRITPIKIIGLVIMIVGVVLIEMM